jgi:hypothetical protein
MRVIRQNTGKRTWRGAFTGVLVRFPVMNSELIRGTAAISLVISHFCKAPANEGQFKRTKMERLTGEDEIS